MKRSIWADDYLKLRESLKKIRIEKKLSQNELARILEKPRTFVTKYENADRNLDFLEVIKICRACDKNPLTFLKEILKNTNI